MNSLSIFFPCYNDKGTIGTLVWEAKATAEKLTDDYEVIVVEDGSSDGSRELLESLQKEWPELKVVYHEKNRGYGGALQSGFRAATKDLVFYCDGDGQYDVRELPLLWEKMTPDVDIVNGYKLKRQDPLDRIIIGYIYQYGVKFLFALPIKDVDCDYRLIRRKVFDRVELHSTTGTVTVEIVKKIQQAGFKFAQVGVSHYHRVYGTSQFFTFARVGKTLWRLAFMWLDLMVLHQLERPAITIFLRRIVEANFRQLTAHIRSLFFPVAKGGTVLDLGCGTGIFSPLFTKEQYTGLDLEKKNIEYAKAHYPGKKFTVGDARALDFAADSFDAALVVGVLHHLPDTDARAALKELRRVMKKNGTALVMEDTQHPGFFASIIHAVDRGAHIRTEAAWEDLFSPLFKAERHPTFLSGLGSYYVCYTLVNDKH